jgi:hypothetical protein
LIRWLAGWLQRGESALDISEDFLLREAVHKEEMKLYAVSSPPLQEMKITSTVFLDMLSAFFHVLFVFNSQDKVKQVQSTISCIVFKDLSAVYYYYYYSRS